MSQAPLTKTSARKKALDYHRLPKPGKLSVESSKPCATQEDLSLAYTPGVAEPVREIARIPKRPTTTPTRATWSR